MTRLITVIAAAFALLIAVVPPVVFFELQHLSLARMVESEVALAAGELNRLISQDPEIWEFEPRRVGTIIEAQVGPLTGSKHRKRVLNVSGETIAEHGRAGRLPIMSRMRELHDSGVPVGRVEVSVSIFGCLLWTAGVAAASLILGALVFATVRVLPLRALDRALTDLRRAKNIAEGEKRKAEAARVEAEMASRTKTEFLANMSHELRTPLNAIIGFSEMMTKQVFGPVGAAIYRDYARDINDSGQHLLHLINDILDLSRIEVGRLGLDLTHVDATEIIKSCCRSVLPRAEEAKIELAIWHDRTGELRILADETRLKQVLLNLLSNAIKFTPAGGMVTISTRTDGASLVAISIADTGIGMRPDDVVVALEPFRQVDNSFTRKHQGAGLGLPLAKRLTELQNGVFTIDSAVGRGTTVTVTLPAAAHDLQVASAPRPSPTDAYAQCRT